MVERGRIRRSVSDLFGLFVVPAVLALLPWPVTYRVLKSFAARTASFRDEADVAWNVMREYAGHCDERAWKMRYKLVRWVERVDTYLVLVRGTAWWLSQVDRQGEWPRAGAPGLLLTCHWGAGHWLWRCLQSVGVRAYFLARRPQVADLGVSRVALWYGALRSRSFTRIGSLGPIFTGGSHARMQDAFASGCSVVGMLDLPAQGSRSTRRVRLLGHEAILRCGLVELARDAAVDVALVSCGLDIESGRRRLIMEKLPAGLTIEETMARYAAHLDARLRETPEHWMMWHEARAIFTRPAG